MKSCGSAAPAARRGRRPRASPAPPACAPCRPTRDRRSRRAPTSPAPASSRCSCRSSAAAPATCGVAIDVPSKTAKRDASVFGSVDERIWPPGAETSGLRSWPNAVGPGRREARDHAAAAGLELERVAADADRRPAAVRGHDARRCVAVEVRDHPAGDRERRSGCRSPRPRGCRRRRCRRRPRPALLRPSSRTGRGRAGRARSRRRASRGQRVAASSAGGPQRCGRRAAVACRRSSRRRRACWSVAPHAAGARSPFAPRNGMPVARRRARRGDVERGGEDVRVRDGGDRDRVGRRARRAGGAECRSRRGRCRRRSPARRRRRRRRGPRRRARRSPGRPAGRRRRS